MILNLKPTYTRFFVFSILSTTIEKSTVAFFFFFLFFFVVTILFLDLEKALIWPFSRLKSQNGPICASKIV